MPVYLVTTEETVKGTYVVRVDSKDEAREKFDGHGIDGHGIDWEGVEQTSYEAFMIKSTEIAEVM
jgi:hypothetical protein